MTESSYEDVSLDAVGYVVLEAVAAIGDEPQARFAFFRRLLAVATDAAEAKRFGRGTR